MMSHVKDRGACLPPGVRLRILTVLTLATAFGGFALGGCGTSGLGGFGPIPTPLPPALTMMAYAPDGSNIVTEGVVGTPVHRPKVMGVLPQLKSYGFGRFVQMAYVGIARTEEDAANYYAPLIEASRATGVRVVPGTFAQGFIDDLFGLATAPPWNVVGSNALLRHPMNPIAVGEQAYWDELVLRCRNLARGAQASEVLLDQEFIYYLYRFHEFWSDENLAKIKPMARDAVNRLRNEGIFLIFYHPAIIGTDVSINRIAEGLFGPENADDPLASIEHFCPLPYYNNPPFGTQSPAQAESDYAVRGFNTDRVRIGFAGPHIAFGFTPTTLDAFLKASPDVIDRAWYVAGAVNYEALSASFGAMPPVR